MKTTTEIVTAVRNAFTTAGHPAPDIRRDIVHRAIVKLDLKPAQVKGRSNLYSDDDADLLASYLYNKVSHNEPGVARNLAGRADDLFADTERTLPEIERLTQENQTLRYRNNELLETAVAHHQLQEKFKLLKQDYERLEASYTRAVADRNRAIVEHDRANEQLAATQARFEQLFDRIGRLADIAMSKPDKVNRPIYHDPRH